MSNQSSYPGPDSIVRRVLPNGITVLIYENFASQTVVIDGGVRTGALAETAEKAGLAAFTASLLMRGTQKRTFDEIYESLESVGAEVGFTAGRHMTSFSGHSLVEDFDLVLDIIAESLCRPVFPPEQVEQLRGEILTSLLIRANDTRYMATLRFYETLYGREHPYGRSSSGYTETISAITREDIVNFHNTWYGPKGMLVVIVGAIKAEDALARIEQTFGAWENPQQPELPPIPSAAPPAQLTRVQTSLPEKSQTDIVMGLPGPLRSAPDYLDASLMNTILGVFGMMGRIGKSVREEQGLAYYAYSQLHGSVGPLPWYAVAGVAPENVEKTIESIRAEIGRMQNELVPEDELEDSKAYRIGSMPVGLETNSGLASVIGDIEFYQLGLDYLQRYPDMIREITPERIQAAAQKYLSTEQLVVSVAGP
ncbi:MAG: insulinase family protein [Chloroflexi bacterium]|nr:MAG: insulinase family protein [Chloroflexota bacterium]